MNTIVISAINHSEMGLICTNLANELGHHLVAMMINLQLDQWPFIVIFPMKNGDFPLLC